MSRLIADFSSLDCADNDIEIPWDEMDAPIRERLGLSRPDNGLVKIPLSVAVRELACVENVAYYNEKTRQLSVPIEHCACSLLVDCYVLCDVDITDIESGVALDQLAILEFNDIVRARDDGEYDRYANAKPVWQTKLGEPVSVMGDAYGAFPWANDKWMQAYEDHQERMEKEQQEAEEAYQHCLIKEGEEYLQTDDIEPAPAVSRPRL